MKKKVFQFLVLLLILLLILHGDDVISYTHDALFLCYNIIIPTLFPFFICSGLLIYSGFCESLSKIFAPFMKPLFGINPSGSAAFILGIISGYPLGAVTVCDLYEASYLSKKEAERLLAFSNNSGPLFILGALGVGLFSSIKTGILLYLAHILGAISVGITLKLLLKPAYNPNVGHISTQEKSIGEIFSYSLTNAVNNILSICGAIMFFSVFSRILLDFVPDFYFKTFLLGIMEFAGGNFEIINSDLSIAQKIIGASVITGFAGICVHIQVLGVVARSGLKIKTYILGKILHGLYSGIYAAFILYFADFFTKKAALPTMGYGFFMSSLSLIFVITVILLLHIIRDRRLKH